MDPDSRDLAPMVTPSGGSDAEQALVAAPTRASGGRFWNRHPALVLSSGGIGVALFHVVRGIYISSGEVSMAAGAAGLALGLLTLALSRPTLVRRRRERRFRSAPLIAEAALHHGARVRVVGRVVAAQGTFRTVTGRQAVLARYVGARGGMRGPRWLSSVRWEIHVVGFTISTADGGVLAVDPANVLLLPHPPPDPDPSLMERRPLYTDSVGNEDGRERLDDASWVYDEECVVPGQLVEVVGTLDQVPHPSGAAASDRSPRVLPVLRAGSNDPVLVRPHVGTLLPATGLLAR